jgi:GT2 family glycosyltransferase
MKAWEEGELKRSTARSKQDHMERLMESRDQAISWLWQRLDSEETRYEQIIHEYDVTLANIKRSFGYKFMRFYSSRIDKLFPEGTRRGEFRKVVTGSILSVTNQGIRSYFSQVTEKIKRREFTIVRPTEQVTQPAPTQETTVPYELSDENLNRQLQEFFSIENSLLELPSTIKPRVSILIPTYNKAAYTHKCLQTLRTNTASQFEVIIVDNNSTDETGKLLDRVRNARIIRNKENRFLAPAWNQAAQAAQAEYLLFLNTDVFVQPDCINMLVKTLESALDIGAVGAKLIGRDGRLLEAGSIIWSDGSTFGYGRGEDPDNPQYNFLRDVDYCSGACLLVRRDLFEKLGGLDESFVPMYYEDTDLCVRIWRSGFRVVYQPLAAAVHVEFGSSSFTDAKHLMDQRRVEFVAKHSEFLSAQFSRSQSNVLRARNRRSGLSILIIDDCVPKPAEGAGFPRMYLMLKTLARLGYKITFLPLLDQTSKQPETEILTQLGVEILWRVSNPVELLRERSGTFDIALISRAPNAIAAAGAIRATNPNTPLVYDAEALGYRREQLARSLGLSGGDPRFESEETEFSIIRSADYVICVSDLEKGIVQQKVARQRAVMLWGHAHKVDPTQTPFEKRSGLLFVGGFKSSPAHNDDAVIYFAKTLLPRIQERIPDCRLIVAGSNPPESITSLASETITIRGYVQNLKELYEKCRVFVAPIRFAAGTMWKVTEAMSYGIPCVLSSVAAQGLRGGEDLKELVATDDEDFIQKTVRLYREESLWNQMRNTELEYVAKNFSPVIMEKDLDNFFKAILQEWNIENTLGNE